MKKQLILSFLLILTLTGLVSASLCLGNDKYYHNCDDSQYFDDSENDYDNEYYYHGKYYPTRDYYYREYYRPKHNAYSKNYVRDYYKETTEYTHTIESLHEDKYGYESIKVTISEKTEVERDYKWPYSWYEKYFR